MKKVFVQGSFDLFHYGHLKYLREAKKHGDYLVVGVNTDKLYSDYRRKKPIIPFEFRKEVVMAIDCVDEVIAASNFSPLDLLKEHNIDVFIIYDEWEGTKQKEMSYMKQAGGESVVVSFSNKTLSSSVIKQRVINNYLNGDKQ